MPLPAPRILVVDDTDANRVVLQMFLQRYGCSVDLAVDGSEAIAMAPSGYDAILMDIEMPNLDGFAATKAIRAAERGGRRTPIIAVTAYVSESVRTKCLDCGMDAYFPKPLHLAGFMLTLGRLISGRSSPSPAPRNEASFSSSPLFSALLPQTAQ